jgi:hypothetical protein
MRWVKGYIRAITFTNCKVRYSVKLDEDNMDTTFHNIDSVWVKPRNAEPIEFAHCDNYS